MSKVKGSVYNEETVFIAKQMHDDHSQFHVSDTTVARQ